MKLARYDTQSLLLGAAAVGVLGIVLGAAQNPFTAVGQEVTILTAEQAEILRHMSLVELEDGQGGNAKTIRFSGVNVQVVNGLGATNGFFLDPESTDPLFTTTNGLGNLIVGYNELRGEGDDRTGSHNLAIGRGHNFKSYGGFAVGAEHDVAGPYASVSGGFGNVASGSWSTVAGGIANTASGPYAFVGGGTANQASGESSTVSGGVDNDATNGFQVVVGETGAASSLLDELLFWCDFIAPNESSTLSPRDEVSGVALPPNNHSILSADPVSIVLDKYLESGDSSTHSFLVPTLPLDEGAGLTCAVWFWVEDSGGAPVGTTEFLACLGTGGEVVSLRNSAGGNDLVASRGVESAATSFTLDEWHHALVTLDSAGEMRVYLDGGLVDVVATSPLVGEDINNVRFRTATSAPNFVRQRRDGFMLWGRVLSEDERQAVHNSGEGIRYLDTRAVTSLTSNLVAYCESDSNPIVNEVNGSPETGAGGSNDGPGFLMYNGTVQSGPTEMKVQHEVDAPFSAAIWFRELENFAQANPGPFVIDGMIDGQTTYLFGWGHAAGPGGLSQGLSWVTSQGGMAGVPGVPDANPGGWNLFLLTFDPTLGTAENALRYSINGGPFTIEDFAGSADLRPDIQVKSLAFAKSPNNLEGFTTGAAFWNDRLLTDQDATALWNNGLGIRLEDM